MPTIGIIGANGQVGSEVCLYLSQMDDVTVVPICRTEYGSAFLRRCGLFCRHGSLLRKEEATELLSDCDLVADFSLPKGLPSEIRAGVKTIVTNSIKTSPHHSRFVYISSTMAFGMSLHSSQRVYRHYVISRSVYSATKRFGERLAIRLGRKAGREIYILRLGQVHGDMQSVSRRLIRELRDETVYVPEGLSDTVFAFTIAEALRNIAVGNETPGVYTLVSVPQWTWREIHEFYARRLGIQPQSLELKADNDTGSSFSMKSLFNIVRYALKISIGFVTRNRELFMAHLLYAFPRLEQRAKALNLIRNASKEISQGIRQNRYTPFDPLICKLPGQRLRSLSDSRKTMMPFACKVRLILENITK